MITAISAVCTLVSVQINIQMTVFFGVVYLVFGNITQMCIQYFMWIWPGRQDLGSTVPRDNLTWWTCLGQSNQRQFDHQIAPGLCDRKLNCPRAVWLNYLSITAQNSLSLLKRLFLLKTLLQDSQIRGDRLHQFGCFFWKKSEGGGGGISLQIFCILNGICWS